MSLRSKTQKAKKFGTPTTPSVSTPKAPSPKQPKIVGTVTAPSVVSGTAPTRTTTTRKTITQAEAGIVAQAGFKAQLQVLTGLPSRQLIGLTQQLANTREFKTKVLLEKQIQDKEQEIIDIEHELLVEFIEQEDIELSPTVNQIINALESGKQLYPDWFHSNIIWVKSGQISNKAFLDSYYYLSNEGVIHSPITEPEIVIEEPEIRLLSANFKISFTDPNIGGFSSSIPIEDYQPLNNFMNDNYENIVKLTLIGSSTNPPISTLSEVLNNIKNLLASVVPEPEPEPEPEVTTSDVIPPGEEVIVDEEKYIPVKPGQFKMSDLTNTNVWVGLMLAGVLAVPVFSSILSKNK